MIGLSVRTGLPWQYFARQDDAVISTYLQIIVDADKGRRGSPGRGEPQTAHRPAGRLKRSARQMRG